MKKRYPIVLSMISVLALTTGCASNNTTEQLDKQDKSTSRAEESVKKIKDYGEKVKVKNKMMNVYTAGSGDKTIVLLPGLSEFSQVYSHHNLIKELAKTYKVVVVEPFGYGLSDTIDEPRTIDNITEEVHEAVQQLGLKDYMLMGHSIAGVYSMNYVEKYPGEVLGFIGLDTSTPTMHGNIRLDVEPSGAELVKKIRGVDKEINEQYRLIAEKIAGNKSNVDETARSYDNIHSVENSKLPKGFPALYFLGQENVDDMKNNFMKNFGVKKGWVEQHEDLSVDPKDYEIHVLNDGHFLYETFYKEITEKVNAFVQKNNIWQ